MDTKNIRDLIAKVQEKGGAALRTGSVVSALNAIVDAMEGGGSNEPLIVEGTVERTGSYPDFQLTFTPNEGELSFDETVEKFTKGQNVKLKFNYSEKPQVREITSYVESTTDPFHHLISPLDSTFYTVKWSKRFDE